MCPIVRLAAGGRVWRADQRPGAVVKSVGSTGQASRGCNCADVVLGGRGTCRGSAARPQTCFGSNYCSKKTAARR